MTDATPLLRGLTLRKLFKVKRSPTASSGILTAVDDVTLELRIGETLGIAGESGCGKSTLGRILAGLTKPDGGRVEYQGERIDNLSPGAFAAFRRQTQVIFQDPFSSLNPRMRIGDIIGEPLVVAGQTGQLRPSIEAIMGRVGLPPDFFDRFPHEFSGGQRQRIGIARALAASPGIIIADEPVSSLDVSIQAQIINLLQDLKESYHLSLAIISHDLSVLKHICDRLAVMYLGIIVETAPASALFEQCLHPYTEALIAAVPKIASVPQEKAALLQGDIPSPLAIPSGCRFHTRCRYAQDICRREIPPLEEKRPGRFAACHFSESLYLSGR